jgi:hypothetical protein
MSAVIISLCWRRGPARWAASREGAPPGNLTAQLVLAPSLLAKGDLDRATVITRRLVEGARQAAPV